MENFTYYTPTKVIFGRNAEMQIGQMVKEQGSKKVLIHYGGGSIKRSGLLDRVKKILDEEGIAYVELGGVVPNPRLSLVYEGIQLAKKENVDLILAVGGGSAIDSAKAIGYGVYSEGDVWDFYIGKRKPEGCLPIGVILTIAATGSEMSHSSVITKEEGWMKRSCGSDFARPKFALMNPELTMTLPAYQTFSGITDIMMHTMERYFSAAGSMAVTDSFAEGLLRTVMKNAEILLSNPKDYDARAEIMWCSSLSHNGLTGCGTDGGDWMCHKIEHEIGGLFDVAHGAGLAAIWGTWARFVYQSCLERFEKFARCVMDVEDTGNAQTTGLKGIEAMEDFFRKINMPTNLSELGVTPTDEEIQSMAEKWAMAVGGKGGKAKLLDAKDVAEILHQSKTANLHG